MHDAGLPTMSEDTMGSSVYTRTSDRGPDAAASAKAWLTSSTVTVPGTTAVTSVIEPSATGTRRAEPFRRPFMDSITRPVARAAPLEAGTMLMAAARARRRSLWGRSSRF